jgi:proteasome lid subunit RPN8/RPN11
MQQMKQKLRIDKKVLEAIIDHASRELPLEACGYLAEKDGLVTKHYELKNMDHRDDHFTMDAKEQFAAVKNMRDNNLRLAAVYHSHPETPARPSEEDIRLAFDPEISYVIVSLACKKPAVKSFKIKKGNVLPEEIERE